VPESCNWIASVSVVALANDLALQQKLKLLYQSSNFIYQILYHQVYNIAVNFNFRRATLTSLVFIELKLGSGPRWPR
jgi:hypothetical protein